MWKNDLFLVIWPGIKNWIFEQSRFFAKKIKFTRNRFPVYNINSCVEFYLWRQPWDKLFYWKTLKARNYQVCAKSNPCKNGGKCNDGQTGQGCDCSGTGFTGPSCSIPATATCANSPGICNSGTCSDKNGAPGSVSCKCDAGYTGTLCTGKVLGKCLT